MKFECDAQTHSDLAIFRSGQNDDCIFTLFNKTITYGGGYKLKDIFDNPLTDKEQLKERVAAIKYLQQNVLDLKIEKSPCDFIEFYLQQKNKPTSVSKIRAVEKWLRYRLKGDSDYYIVESGVKYTLQLLAMVRGFTTAYPIETLPALLQNFHKQIDEVLTDPDFVFLNNIDLKKPGAVAIAQADHLFRYKGFDKLKQLLDIVYLFDVYLSIAVTGLNLGFGLPVISDNDDGLVIDGLFHPLIKNPVSNNAVFNASQNICFITGTNMAGKSSYLKSIGICIYLSQLGFPVPAVHMETPVFNGLITTINLPDNLSQGNSHFYNEVLRVKHVAQKIAALPKLFVIFDELFRGTNVKDAYDASLSIIRSFAQIKNSYFVVSTHIVEVARELSAIENISFKFMETVFDNGSPSFSYQLKTGVTDERLGMWIVKNEGILDIIADIIKKQEQTEF